MKNKLIVEFIVGLFMIAGIAALVALAFKVSGLAVYTPKASYQVYADFNNIGDLKVRAPVTIGGVHIGEITNIVLDPKTFRARVTLAIDKKESHIPADSSASIFTQGLLGANYISIKPGFSTEMLQQGSVIENTTSAMILENLIGQLIFKTNGAGADKPESNK